MSSKVRVGVIGSQFISTIHAESLLRCPFAEAIAVASPTPGNAEKFAQNHDIPRHFTDYRNLLAMDEHHLLVVCCRDSGLLPAL